MALVGHDAGEACLKRLLPGRRFLVWYDADVVYHERIALWPQTRKKWVILTPALDMYAEVLDGSEGAAGVTRILDFRPGGMLPRLDKSVYRFPGPMSLDDLKGHIREGRRLALEDGAAAGDPPVEVTDVVMPDREVVPLDAMFGGRFVPRRLPLRGAAGGAPPHDS